MKNTKQTIEPLNLKNGRAYLDGKASSDSILIGKVFDINRSKFFCQPDCVAVPIGCPALHKGLEMDGRLICEEEWDGSFPREEKIDQLEKEIAEKNKEITEKRDELDKLKI